jgi:aspartyl-tRNA(Asn)/glutamyl-tRNA(Gln) amidotransferase subunit A
VNRRDILMGLAAAGGQSLFWGGAGAAVARPGRAPAALPDLTLSAAAGAIRRGEISSAALVQACLARIDSHNPKVNAVITAMRRQALAQAAVLDAEATAGRFRSPLHGVPIALKDNIDTADAPTTNASALLTDYTPSEDARVVRLLKQAGAVVIAKTNMSEFAIGSATSATSHFGPVRNPWKRDHVSGGSSGGSGAAVATGMCFGALGTDSGGSVRIPAAWCGLTGLKPTRGLVPNTGVGPGLPLIDTTGPIARTVEDVALLLDHITGYDPLDISSVDRPRENYAASIAAPVSALRVGVPRQPFFEKLDPQVAGAVDAALTVIAGLVRDVNDVALKGFETPDDMVLAGDIMSYHNAYYPKRRDDYQPLTRFVLGMLSDALNDPAGGTPSQKIGNQIQGQAAIVRRQRTIDAMFDGFDVIVMPTMKALAPTVKDALVAESAPTPVFMPWTVNTFPFNMLGLPALSVPCGFSRDGLPIGMMIAGPHFSEARLLALGSAYQRATSWHLRRPA